MNGERKESKHYVRLNIDNIKNKLNTEYLGREILYLDEVDSTNNIAKEYGKQEGNHGLLVIAEGQNAGKGRLGRSWNSPIGSGVWMSLVLKPNIEQKSSPMLTLIAALAVNVSMRKITGLKTVIKWPNDIVLNGKKTCGILTEMTASADKQGSIIMGIGINVNQEEFPEELREKATSLWIEGKRQVSREALISEIMNQLELYFKKFCLTESMAVLRDEYNVQLIHQGKRVRIIEKNVEFEGTALGIDESGALLVQVEQSDNGIDTPYIKTVLSGEISVRGTKGYV
jgi:BirA family biotin operon repressor/biotin-[acetyl-CoA-carboxylase] ligase